MISIENYFPSGNLNKLDHIKKKKFVEQTPQTQSDNTFYNKQIKKSLSAQKTSIQGHRSKGSLSIRSSGYNNRMSDLSNSPRGSFKRHDSKMKASFKQKSSFIGTGFPKQNISKKTPNQ